MECWEPGEGGEQLVGWQMSAGASPAEKRGQCLQMGASAPWVPGRTPNRNECLCPPKDRHKNVQSGFIRNNPKLDTVRMSANCTVNLYRGVRTEDSGVAVGRREPLLPQEHG